MLEDRAQQLAESAAAAAVLRQQLERCAEQAQQLEYERSLAQQMAGGAGGGGEEAAAEVAPPPGASGRQRTPVWKKKKKTWLSRNQNQWLRGQGFLLGQCPPPPPGRGIAPFPSVTAARRGAGLRGGGGRCRGPARHLPARQRHGTPAASMA